MFRGLVTILAIWLTLWPLVSNARPYVKLARFRGDAKAAVSITFDDGYPGQVDRAIPILNEHDLRATFFLHTDNIKDSWSANWDAWKSAIEEGHEVGSHSKTHPDLTHIRNSRRLRDEIEGSADLIEQKLGVRPVSFAYPFSADNDVVRREVLRVYPLDRSNCRIWGGDTFSVEDAVRNIDQAVEKGEWFYSMLHGVDEKTFSQISSSVFEGIVAYLDKNRDTIWTDTYGAVGLYMMARRLTEIRFKDIEKDSFCVRLSLPEDVTHYDRLTIPLTVMVELGAQDGSLAKVYCDDRELPSSVSTDGKFLLFECIPDGSWVQINWGE
jgi:peptidoglycan/xylan/chitin deacetylase (PgdA/CDA1 family)